MYNRYIPQPDGSYRRNCVREPNTAPRNNPPPPKPADVCVPPAPVQEPCPCAPAAPACTAPLPPCPQPPKQPPRQKQQPREPGGIGSFFKNLIPKGLDTADLLIIILLLLMAGDKDEDQANALLTLALYFFM